jgi:hypothetical protein
MNETQNHYRQTADANQTCFEKIAVFIFFFFLPEDAILSTNERRFLTSENRFLTNRISIFLEKPKK